MSLYVDLHKQLGSFQLRVQLETGSEPLALLGASGCGKSLTLRCIAGVLKPDSGKILLNGRTLFDSDAGINLPPQQRGVGYLFQQYALFPNMTVRQNIACAAKDRRRSAAIASEKIHQFRLDEAADLRPSQLSGGQQQRTALARILASSPEAILLDEPLSALDTFLRDQLELELAETLGNFPGPVLWVTHDRGEAFRNCRQVCVLDNGKSQPVTALEELFSRPLTEAAARLSGCQNYTEAIPRGDSVFLPQWGLTLPCGRHVPSSVDLIGIRAHHIYLTPDGFPCHVLRVIQDVFSTIVLLKPVHARQDAPPLRMELSREDWSACSGNDIPRVSVAPQHIVLLNTKGEPS